MKKFFALFVALCTFAAVSAADIPGNICLWVRRPSGDEVLLPFHEDLVMGMDPTSHTLALSIPDGLLD